jgi:uncharacterized membrane protein
VLASLRAAVLLALTISVLGACTGEAEDDHHEESEGVETESICPPNSDLTYESFGQPFMQTYCTHCHSSTLAGAARNGAPDGHDFDTLDGILLVAHHIDEYAAAGPAATNTAMPPSDPRPSDEERQQLGQWLACEAP